MKSLLISLAFGLMAMALLGADAATPVSDMKPPAKWSVNKKTMAKDGRFHYLHVKKEKMDCSDCHANESRDRVFLRGTEAPPDPLSAHVDRKECLDCHSGNKKPLWYGLKR